MTCNVCRRNMHNIYVRFLDDCLIEPQHRSYGCTACRRVQLLVECLRQWAPPTTHPNKRSFSYRCIVAEGWEKPSRAEVAGLKRRKIRTVLC